MFTEYIFAYMEEEKKDPESLQEIIRKKSSIEDIAEKQAFKLYKVEFTGIASHVDLTVNNLNRTEMAYK